MTTIRLILGDQLSENISSLDEMDPQRDVILICEVHDETVYVKHHKKKIAFLFSAMRHFAQELREKKYTVDYVTLDDPENRGSFKEEVLRAIDRHKADEVVVTFPGEYRVWQDMKSWSKDFGIKVSILPDQRFLCPPKAFRAWADSAKSLRMEYFYRHMRRELNILMDAEGKPEGGQWNYDHDNRAPPPKDAKIPELIKFKRDKITEDVLALVEKKFDKHFGDLEPFTLAVTRKQALQAMDDFIKNRLENFGTYQDAMLTDEPFLYHSHLSFYINCGLLDPMEVVRKVEKAYHDGHVPINAAEGFIRQIIGWREYVRGIYWYKMPGYAHENYLKAERQLPDFFWTAQTDMNCMHHCIGDTMRNAYAHHIQRLMVIGNFCLLTGMSVEEVNEWYLIVYADAYEWVEMPNVSGLILFADGGLMASKPYIAGGSYINKMSNYCKGCRYDVKAKTGPDACPFNYLYWNFLLTHQDKLGGNQRLSMMCRTLDKMDVKAKDIIKEDAVKFLSTLKPFEGYE